MGYLFQKRNEHYHLNHYNIRQLIYLCKKLSCVEGHDFPDQVYQLLNAVACNLSYTKIFECLDEVTKIDEAPALANLLVNGKSSLYKSLKFTSPIAVLLTARRWFSVVSKAGKLVPLPSTSEGGPN